MVPRDRWRRVVVRLSPEFDLLSTVLFLKFLLESTLKLSVVPLIKLPCTVDSQVILAYLVKNDLASHVGSGEEGRVKQIELVAEVFEQLAGVMGLLDSFIIEWDVYPAAAPTVLVPN